MLPIIPFETESSTICSFFKIKAKLTFLFANRSSYSGKKFAKTWFPWQLNEQSGTSCRRQTLTHPNSSICLSLAPKTYWQRFVFVFSRDAFSCRKTINRERFSPLFCLTCLFRDLFSAHINVLFRLHWETLLSVT
jgi:hypothetical protein